MVSFLEWMLFMVTLIVSLVTYINRKFSYWEVRNVPYIQPQFPFGTLENLLDKKHTSAQWKQKQYRHFKSMKCKFGGLYEFMAPSLLLLDLEMIKNVLTKDFHYFSDHGVYFNEKSDPLSANLAMLEGHKWRTLRAKLTPTFSSGKLKMMFETLRACAEPLTTAMNELCQKTGPIDMKQVSTCFTTDVISSCAFGLDCNSFTNPENDFIKYGKALFSWSSKFQAFKFYIASTNPFLTKLFGLSLTAPDTERFFLRVVRETVEYRRANNVTRQDLMQLLMNLKNEDGTGMTVKEIAAQAYVFFLAGFESSSGTIACCLHELAINQEIQNRAREEIAGVLSKYDGKITYDAIMDMKYLSCVVNETLRKYPITPSLARVCVEDYEVPGTNVTISKGTSVRISIYALHYDPEYFPSPEKFDPDRFSESSRSGVAPFSFMPLGEGPRMCIGSRFGEMQVKVGLVTLLNNFRFLVNSKTQAPIKFSIHSRMLSIDGGIWLDVEKLSMEETK